MHPSLQFTRLGAHLREHAQADDTVGQLARAVLTNADHDGTPRLSEPLELTPLHALRDEMLDNPQHPLAQAFNWERLPEKVALDRAVSQWARIHPHWSPRANISSIVHDPDSDFHGKNIRVDRALEHAHADGHIWATRRDVKDSARRLQASNTREPYSTDSLSQVEETHRELLEGDGELSSERY